MEEILISVIMSTFNETLSELDTSVSSILNQSHHKIEFIIVDDNPQNIQLKNYLESIKDERVQIIYNEKNKGLVSSLNIALKYANGEYIARMDADDISEPNRLENQLKFIQEKSLDFIGCWIKPFNQFEVYKQSFPTKHNSIKFFLRWGNCIPHPTWLIKKEVYETMDGYREIARCEDYDFLCRAINAGYKVGNLNEYLLRYRIRDDSISNSNPAEQYILRRYIATKRKNEVNIIEINNYIHSFKFKKEVGLYKACQKHKVRVKDKQFGEIIYMFFNKYTYILFAEKLGLKLRNRYKK